jgi:hypothetical protein
MKVYKYRCNKDKELFERDLETFSNNSFFAPTFKGFGDELEANFNEQISITLNCIDKSNIHSKTVMSCLKDVIEFKEKIGVYCLTKRFDNEYMWNEYANENQGYCIEYELEKITDKSKNIDFSENFDVIYDFKTPILNINDIGSDSLIQKMFGVKRLMYSQEEEVRLIFNHSSIKNHHYSAITAIYFGEKTDKALIQKFYEKFKNREIKIYRMLTNENNVLSRKIINEFSRELKFDLNKFNYEILKHSINEHIEVFYIHLIDELIGDEIKQFALAFEEKNCHKLCNLHIYNNSEIKDLIEIYPLPDKDYIRYADSYIANADFSSENIVFEFPYKDFKYNKLKMYGLSR